MKIMVTGGAGFIGSHTVLQLLEHGHEVMVYDNLRNASPVSLERVEELAGVPVETRWADLLDTNALEAAVGEFQPDAVIHFAGLKAVGESAQIPYEYYMNNVVGTLNLLAALKKHGVTRLVFSSSATVYDPQNPLPLLEGMRRNATNPYGRTKQQIEEILEDVAAADPTLRVAVLRYFNPAGAHDSGRIGEDPVGTPNNLLPFVAQVAVGMRPLVRVFGDDYDTPDGTGVRDYIHVVDLAAGHLAALQYLESNSGLFTWNLGTGRGTSVLEVIDAFAKVTGRPVPFEIVDRRPGDVAVSLADPSKALRELGWKAERSFEAMCADHWRWQESNPSGYTALSSQPI
ncbi:UDP-glucose 4-epimerase GalE [Pseudarthrobacter enclensis]|uniref:UDP-glucose 4-epimerase n=1 Tax=Pseudarthrobacter enclensis TaxID=993070 RepID=A0ABT9RTX4_9MICC|nr:UDP-glucose 4-epimerase GalE [Pseudarthrobacter enclensis]MDP9888235.1 UDP-glucose 4-epimerase [Pseudarthrobacter enclensis]